MKTSPATQALREKNHHEAIEALGRFAAVKVECASIAEAGTRIGVSFQRAGQLWARARNELAERVAEGATPFAAGEALGFSPRAARHVWATICKGLGEKVTCEEEFQ